MRDFDKCAIEEYGIPSIVLMENAALRVVEFLEAKFAPLSEKKIVILCGKGNNGGDGLAIARHLQKTDCTLYVLVASRDLQEYRGDAGLNAKIFRESSDDYDWFSTSTEEPDWPRLLQLEMWDADVIVDAMLGTGFNGAMREPITKAVFHARQSDGKVVGVDIPSGFIADSGEGSEALKADFTVTFVGPKCGFFVRDGNKKCGEIWIGDIGTTWHQSPRTWTGVETLGLETAQKLLPNRTIDAHKGDAGRVLIIGGSFGMSGAVALASRAALSSGCGLCIAAIPEKILPIFAASILEATSHPLPCDDSGKLLERAADELAELWRGVQVVALGPGIGRSDETQNLVRCIVRECPAPLIIDADALFALPSIAEDVKNREADTILTPHPGEMGTLMGISAAEVNDSRFETVGACAQKYGAIVVLKGARTLVATPDGQIFVNLTGNTGMATGGSGDVLTGTIAGLLAQIKNSESATKLGVYLHGFAGDLAFEELGNGLVAGDIAANLGRALVEIPKREVERINGRLRKLM